MKSKNRQILQRTLQLRSRAASMRERGTSSERALWQLLRGGQLGERFRRQVPLLGSCIVDFLAVGARLVVEVDGGYHAEPARRRADGRRDRRLGKAGYRVLRLRSEQVLGEPEEVRALVAAALGERAR